jgi:hypothetical protein
MLAGANVESHIRLGPGGAAAAAETGASTRQIASSRRAERGGIAQDAADMHPVITGSWTPFGSQDVGTVATEGLDIACIAGIWGRSLLVSNATVLTPPSAATTHPVYIRARALLFARSHDDWPSTCMGRAFKSQEGAKIYKLLFGYY